VCELCIQATVQCRRATVTTRRSALVVTRQMKLSTCTAPSTDVDQPDAAWNQAKSSTHSDRTSATTAVMPTSWALLIESVVVVASALSDYLIQTLNESPRATRMHASTWRLRTHARKVSSSQNNICAVITPCYEELRKYLEISYTCDKSRLIRPNIKFH